MGAIATAFPAFGLEGFSYTREVQVSAAGWVRVPIDLTTARHLMPGAADLHVFSPEGEELPRRVAPLASEGESRSVVVKEVRRVPSGWVLSLDAGVVAGMGSDGAPPHERLDFALARLAVAPAVRLEGSRDGEVWEPLAEGDLFRVGPGGRLRRTSIAYPATDARYLRLWWPEAAGFPEVETVEVREVPGPSVAVASGRAECTRPRPEAVVCRLALPAAGLALRRLTVRLEGEGAAGYRLYQPREASWEPLGETPEGVWRRSGRESRHVLALGESDLRPVAADFLRLEIYGAAAPPRLAGYGVDLAPDEVVFRAREPGPHTLAYGGAASARSGGGSPGPGEAALLHPGPEREHPPPPLPPAATAPGALLRVSRFAASWPVVAPGAVAGQPVRLELPAEVYAATRSGLGDLRLATGRRQIPYLRWTPEAPALAAERRGVAAEPAGRGSRSRVEVPLRHPRLPLTQLALTAPGGPLRRAVAVSYLDARAGLEPGGRTPAAVAYGAWDCAPQAPLPCRELLPLAGGAREVLAVTFEDGDNPPLAGLDAEVWRRRDVLVFVWPQEGSVRLLAGREGLSAPDYDLEGIADELLARPARAAELDLSGAAAEAASGWGRWLLPAALALAGLFLLFLLRRILSSAV